MSARGIDAPGYREAHETVDARLNDALGLTIALDQMATLHPGLSGNDDRSLAITSLINAILESIKSAQSFQDVAWDAQRHSQATAA